MQSRLDLTFSYGLTNDLTLCFLNDSPVGEEVSLSLLKCLIPLGNELLPDVPGEWSNIGSKFGDLMNTAAVLAGAGDGAGHLTLCAAVIKWLEKWYASLQ